MLPVHYKDWGNISYKKAWEAQQQLFLKVLLAKRQQEQENYLVFCEHPHVYTLGKSGQEANLLLGIPELQQNKAEFVKVDRGGDITYHGPGQIVGYPIVNLMNWGIGVREYIEKLEQSIIDVLAMYSIFGGRVEGATGVWLDIGTERERKIAAIGVKVSRHITMHGFAFNINTDLKYFSYINPCGFIDKGVTSLALELGQTVNIDTIRKQLKDCIANNFEMQLIDG